MKKKISFIIILLLTLTWNISFAEKKSDKGVKKNTGTNGGLVIFENPYGDSSEWITIDLYEEINFKGEHWVIDIYGSKVTIKDEKGKIHRKIKDNFFKSAKIGQSTGGGIYFFDDSNLNREKEKNYGWVFLPSSDAVIEVKNFDKEIKSSKAAASSYYTIIKKKKKKKLAGNISSILIKLSKMR